MAIRIHITSSGPRTGTTLLTEAMRTCFDIDCVIEHEAPLAMADSSFGKCNLILTKDPTLSYGIDRLLKLNKNLRIICVYRDPRDMICSFHGRAQDIYYCNLDYWFYFTQQYKTLVDLKNILFIKYEDFVSDPNHTQQQIQNFIPELKKTFDFSNYHLHAQPNKDSLYALKSIRPIGSTSVGLWKNHLPRLKQQFMSHSGLSDSLIQFGYEEDQSWERLLEGVEAVQFETFKKQLIHAGKPSYRLAYMNMILEKYHLNPNKVLFPIKIIKRLFSKRA